MSGKEKKSQKVRLLHYADKNRDFIRSAGLLNATYFVSCLGDRLWTFALGLFITHLGGLSWVAVGQLIDSASRLLLSPIVGAKLDNIERNKGMQLVLAANNLSILCSCSLFFAALTQFEAGNRTTADLFLIQAIICNSLARVAGGAQRTIFTKDWVVLIVQSSRNGKLSTQNSLLTLVDQTVASIAPLVAGLFIDSAGLRYTCICLLVWNIVSWTVEAASLSFVFRVTPALSAKREPKTNLAKKRVSGGISAWHSYFRQPCFLAAFGLALCYMTILGFDSIAISYGVSQGLSASLLGAFRSGGAFLGALGALAYPLLERRVGLLATALLGYSLQVLFINFCSVSTLVPGNPFDAAGYFSNATLKSWVSDASASLLNGGRRNLTAAAGGVEASVFTVSEMPPTLLLFFSGIMLARFGLWMADPSISQIMQEEISSSERFAVFGVHSSVCSAFSIIKDLLVLAFPLTATFGLLTNLSCGFSVAGFSCLLIFVLKNKCSDPKKDDTVKDVEATKKAPVATTDETEMILLDSARENE